MGMGSHKMVRMANHAQQCSGFRLAGQPPAACEWQEIWLGHLEAGTADLVGQGRHAHRSAWLACESVLLTARAVTPAQ